MSGQPDPSSAIEFEVPDDEFEIEGDDPFDEFIEWAGEADDRAYADL